MSGIYLKGIESLKKMMDKMIFSSPPSPSAGMMVMENPCREIDISQLKFKEEFESEMDKAEMFYDECDDYWGGTPKEEFLTEKDMEI